MCARSSSRAFFLSSHNSLPNSVRGVKCSSSAEGRTGGALALLCTASAAYASAACTASRSSSGCAVKNQVNRLRCGQFLQYFLNRDMRPRNHGSASRIGGNKMIGHTCVSSRGLRQVYGFSSSLYRLCEWGVTRRKDRPPGAPCFVACARGCAGRQAQPTQRAESAAGREAQHPYVPQPTKSVATPRPPSVKGEVLAMLACGCAWLRSRFAPLTAVAASLSGSCRLRRNAGLCLTRGMRGRQREGSGGRSRHP